MLPDFPKFKRTAFSMIVRSLHERVLNEEPVLREIRRRVIHEGRAASLTRADASSQQIEFQSVSGEFQIPREQMYRMSLDQLRDVVKSLARQMAAQQASTLFAEITRTVDETGNTVSVSDLGARDAFLEVERRREVDFDPLTLEPKNWTLVVHPNYAAAMLEQFKKWEADPEFNEAMSRIRETQIEAWRARENRRKLVD